jgi:hypothetical protein
LVAAGATLTSWRLPVEPSMMVTVCPGFWPSARADAAASGFVAAASGSPALAGGGRVYALTIAIGSPP